MARLDRCSPRIRNAVSITREAAVTKDAVFLTVPSSGPQDPKDMPVPFHADEKLGESVEDTMTLRISDKSAPALAGCVQAHPSAPQIVAWPPAPNILLCLLKPGTWSGE